MTKFIPNYINGRWQISSSKNTTEVVNPADETLLALTPMSSTVETISAIEAAHSAFQGWRRTPAQDRIQYLFKFKAIMEAECESLAALITQEHGKTLAEARGSVRRAIQMVEAATSIPTLMMGQNFEDIAKGIDCSSVRRPMGVFAGIVPFNFPAMVPFWFWPFAVATGNTFVLKASERVPMTSVRVFELLESIGLPKGVMNLVQGGKEVVDTLCTHPLVKGVSFVGSTPVAKHVYTLGCSHGKRVQALGGAKNIMVALGDILRSEAHTERSVSTAVESIIGCAGERCLAGSLILCEGDDTYRVFIDRVTQTARGVRIGDGLDPQVDMGPLISKASKDRVLGLIERAIEQGAKLEFDGRKDIGPQKGFFLRPTVLSGITAEMEIAQVEIFGPVILLGKVASLEASIEWINSLPYANTTTLFTTSGGAARKFSYEVDPSMIGINIWVPAPMSFFSFGGSKNSFYGDVKAHGRESIQFYTDTYTTIYRWHHEGSIW